MTRRVLAAAGLAVALAVPGRGAADLPGRGTATVHLGDGTSVPLTSWSLSYEVATWARGSSPAFAEVSRVETTELRFSKKARGVSGSTLEVVYEEMERSGDGGETRKVLVAREVVLTGPDGKRTTLKKEPPHRDLLLPQADKNTFLQPRSLDLLGDTFTGTRRSFCLMSFSALVECHSVPGEQVLKVEFPGGGS